MRSPKAGAACYVGRQEYFDALDRQVISDRPRWLSSENQARQVIAAGKLGEPSLGLAQSSSQSSALSGIMSLNRLRRLMKQPRVADDRFEDFFLMHFVGASPGAPTS